ncbi:hypothetical protein E4U53_003167 [Claviceps sorghi]|nr:hypothetical protein E4U53_003167 [Claviceps sorghi]
MMKAVVFEGPYRVSVQERPVPEILDSGDAIVKVEATALCGSELHVFRGHQKSAPGFIMGHEFTGTVCQVGSGVRTLQIGDRIVSPFTVSCTSVKAPKTISDQALLLMADIFPTGYFGVKSALQLSTAVDVAQSTIVVIGCGPVGLCAIAAASSLNPQHLFAVDAVDSRLDVARRLGAEPLNFKQDADEMRKRVMEATHGRGADIVVEVVGLSPALRTAFELVRPFGVISSIGVHNAEV